MVSPLDLVAPQAGEIDVSIQNAHILHAILNKLYKEG